MHIFIYQDTHWLSANHLSANFTQKPPFFVSISNKNQAKSPSDRLLPNLAVILLSIKQLILQSFLVIKRRYIRWKYVKTLRI